MKKFIGVCLGSSNLSYVKKFNNEIDTKSIPHEGNVMTHLNKLLSEKDNNTVVTVTGRKIRHNISFTSISEPEAVEYAYNYLKHKYPNIDTIISGGSEACMAYKLDSNGKVVNVYTGNKCASGTGEFFMQQIKRMGLKIDEASEIAVENEPYNVAGRCSVFCKSDCTHALNKGIEKGKVVAGLCKMIAGKIEELLKQAESKKILFIGGLSENRLIINYLKEDFSDIITPKESRYFEALGAVLWAEKNNIESNFVNSNNSNNSMNSFSFFPPLKNFKHMVSFKEIDRKVPKDGDECILGLDVGSTTTKAVIINIKDGSLLGKVYLRTSGDPIKAARNCYKKLDSQINTKIKIVGLGVTGSGRHITGLHALTDCVINEIIAHATSAIHFDEEVDTIFEIGGQDAKYTYITNMVPSDYAMNEACSAGTGSFLEEASSESLDITTEKIQDHAIKGENPPDFNDQCSAFISSDIKSAIQSGISIDDIAAGLVYSICQNYISRVKGSRPIGKKIFMQGGVCYNKCIPIAMAGITGKNIIVPPEPGLMGAYGVALKVKEGINEGLYKKKNFNLNELANRAATYENPFVCPGDDECDRKCLVNRIVINNKAYPFGGICDKYYNMNLNNKKTKKEKNYVALREKMVFNDYLKSKPINKNKGKVGIIPSLLTNTYFPLYYNFFTELGYDVILAENIDPKGIEKKGSSFCYPVEQSHGYIVDLLKNEIDYLFLPHILSIHSKNGKNPNRPCPFIQGEAYYLKATFENELNGVNILSPVLDFSKRFNKELPSFIKIGNSIGVNKKASEAAYKNSCKIQIEMLSHMKKIGKDFMENISKEDTVIVLFGRPYNAFSSNGNMGIPHKLVSRGYKVIPFDFLPFEKEADYPQMYWGIGQEILKATKYIKKNDNLFGIFVTNFSCGPDSFILNYFRDILKEKPSLTIELDNHTADAGIDTRIEAFLSIVDNYKRMKIKSESSKSYMPAKLISQGKEYMVKSSDNKIYSLKDDKVRVVIPSMGDFASKSLAKSLKFIGINAIALPNPTKKELKIGQEFGTCKECLPLMLTVGSLIDYVNNVRKNDEITIYFMPKADGPCRFGQYNRLIENTLINENIENVAILSLTTENSYGGLPLKFTHRAFVSATISDIMDDIYSGIITMSKNKEASINVFNSEKMKILDSIGKDSYSNLKKQLHSSVLKINKIPTKKSYKETPKVAIIGEIYVRRDPFSHQYLVDKLAENGIIGKISPTSEWLNYIDYISLHNIKEEKSTLFEKTKLLIKTKITSKYENEIKDIFKQSKFYTPGGSNIKDIIETGQKYISPKLTGEAILTIGAAILEIIDEVSGIISIGPFGCMPGRISESIISKQINKEKINNFHNEKLVRKILKDYPSLPYMAIESDGNLFPQVIEARLDNFIFQAKRLNNKILQEKEGVL